jgi:hypothetical protein
LTVTIKNLSVTINHFTISASRHCCSRAPPALSHHLATESQPPSPVFVTSPFRAPESSSPFQAVFCGAFLHAHPTGRHCSAEGNPPPFLLPSRCAPFPMLECCTSHATLSVSESCRRRSASPSSQHARSRSACWPICYSPVGPRAAYPKSEMGRGLFWATSRFQI